MLCEHCEQNEATVHLTQVVNDNVKKLHLCESCASKSGFDMEGPVSISDVLLGLGAQADVGDVEEASGKVCSVCGLTVAEFRKKGRLGCPSCYETFKKELMPLLKSMHHSTKHIGKMPARGHESAKFDSEIQSLERNIEEAVAAEDFEEAARLRDRIAELRGGGKD